MKSLLLISLLGGFALAGLLLAPLASAHHNAGSLYLLDQTIEIEGVVREFRFVNPHIRIYLDVTTASGAVEPWLAEGQSKNVLIREGWTGAELTPGERISLSGNPPRNGARAIQWRTITRADGTQLGGGTEKDFSGYIEKLRGR